MRIIVYLFLPTTYSESVDQLYKADPHWVAPVLWISEFRNVLALYIRKNIITLEKALLIQEKAELLIAKNAYTVSSARVLSLVDESNCSAYDCEFIALAHQLNIPLITQDKKVLKEFSTTATSVSNFLKTAS